MEGRTPQLGLPNSYRSVSHLQLSYYNLLFIPYLRPALPGVARRSSALGRPALPGVAWRSASPGVARRLVSPGLAQRLTSPGVARRCQALLGAPGVARRAPRCSARPALLGAASLGVPGVARRARRCPALGNARRCPAPLGGSDFTTRFPPRS